MTHEIVDAYCHCGLRKYRPIADIRSVAARFGVSHIVLVQHLGEYDNSYIEDIVADEPERIAGVLMIDVEDPAASDQLDQWTRRNVFRGARFVAGTLATHPDLWNQAAALGLNLVVFDQPTLAPHVDRLTRFAGEHPDTSLVLSHLGIPDCDEAPHFRSQERILSLARHANVFVQISGMHMFGDPPYTPLVPLIEQLVEAFGANRLLYGSNYPVMKDETVYGQELELLRTGRLGVPVAYVEDVLANTARHLWFQAAVVS